jgi:hypothetical protein
VPYVPIADFGFGIVVMYFVFSIVFSCGAEKNGMSNTSLKVFVVFHFSKVEIVKALLMHKL